METPQTSATDDTPRWAVRTAQIISDVFSPLLIPTYGMVLAMTLTGLCILPAGVRLGATFGVAFITAFIPMLFIFILIRMGKVSDTSISDHRQRTAPYIVSILCYTGAAFYIAALHAPLWLMLFFAAAAGMSVISMIINHWWKISVHTGAAGGLAGIVFWLGANHVLSFHPLVVISCAFMLVGLLATSRLILRRHTLLQVVAGALLGFFCEYATLAILI